MTAEEQPSAGRDSVVGAEERPPGIGDATAARRREANDDGGGGGVEGHDMVAGERSSFVNVYAPPCNFIQLI